MLSKDIGIDLGTANVLIYVKGRGVVLDEPSVVAINSDTKQVLEVGEEARRMVGRTPGNIVAIRPLQGGVIADFEITELMLKHFIQKVGGKRWFSHPRILICAPTNITSVEQKAIREAAERCGAKEVFLEDEPKAAAIGAGMDIFQPSGNMVVDIGGGTTEIAVLSLGGIVHARSLPVGGFAMDEAIAAHVRRAHNLLIGEETAERIKKEIGSAAPPLNGDRRMMEIRGRDLVSGVPQRVLIDEREVADGLADSVGAIVRGVRLVLEDTAPEFAADVVDRGIVLAGGGALLSRLDLLLEHATGLPVHVAKDPLTCGVRGAGYVLENMQRLATVLRD